MTISDDMPEGSWSAVWQTPLISANCSYCDWSYLQAPGSLPPRCPHCGRSALVGMGELAAQPLLVQPPELVIPFEVTDDKLLSVLTLFARQIPLAPGDLQLASLMTRVQRIYVPTWLVDAETEAEWWAEMGFDYQVVSHRERYSNGRWQTERVTETRVRWEPRLGRLRRTYSNQHAPALEDAGALAQKLGPVEMAKALPYKSEQIAGHLVRPADRLPDDAWNDAVAALRERAADECRQAASAQHLRDFRWTSRFPRRDWTLMLAPLFSTYYLDDDEQAQVVLINGQTGQLWGRRRSSMARARRWSLFPAVVAVFLLALTLALSLLALSVPAAARWVGYSGLAALAAMLVAATPLLIAWRFNRRYSAS